MIFQTSLQTLSTIYDIRRYGAVLSSPLNYNADDTPANLFLDSIQIDIDIGLSLYEVSPICIRRLRAHYYD